ncbi:esterase-like activity of phytase family protein [Tropicimonas sp. TH_r6]|uniref:esterase-like activity of phytase family protein n=1 Tax=Tropicimonas sp. TH_r6 TaxID=3082085 RepID=UPI002955757D|nr:esterase-like activity of phytase family protein [Tropicimonas sp. TH_r6]MDV7143415.1 esterase-like activity of phytase family protein [Tropicimonas sp. TH_r6]
MRSSWLIRLLAPLCFLAGVAAIFEWRYDRAAFLGQVVFPKGMVVDGTRVGGLSGLAMVGDGRFLAVSDDQEAPRLYSLEIDLSDGRLSRGDVRVTGATHFRAPDGTRIATPADFEGIRIAPDGEIVVADEGQPWSEVNPRLRTFSPELVETGSFAPIVKTTFSYRINTPWRRPFNRRGVRPNAGFESVAITPDGQRLVTATEQSLIQDGPWHLGGEGSPARIVVYDFKTGRPGPEYIYETEMVPVLDLFAHRHSPVRSGLVELLALDNNGQFLALERSYSYIAGFDAKLFRIDTTGATDVSDFGLLPKQYSPVRKELVADLSRLGIALGNLEGMAFGPRLDARRRTLLLVSDDNFRPIQRTRLIALALDLPIDQVTSLSGQE